MGHVTEHWEAEQAFFACMDRVRALRRQYAITSDMQQWEKERHLHRLQRSGRFRYVKEFVLYHTEPCTAERWIGFALTLGHVLPLLDLGLPEDELGLGALRQVAERTLGATGLHLPEADSGRQPVGLWGQAVLCHLE